MRHRGSLRLAALAVTLMIAVGAGIGLADAGSDATLDTRPGACAALHTDQVQGNGIWGEQEQNAPGIDGRRANDRISLQACSPGRGQTYAPNGPALRVELHPFDNPATPEPADGDVNPVGNSSRAEVYDEYVGGGQALTTPWADWPLASEGGEHWFHVAVYVDPTLAYSDSRWRKIIQFKSYHTRAPLALGIDGNRFKLVGNRNVLLGYASRGVWHDFLIHAKFDPVSGGIEIWQDNAHVMTWWAGSTMNTYSGALDPVYLKWGDYRATSWPTTDVLWFGPMRVGSTRGSVQ